MTGIPHFSDAYDRSMPGPAFSNGTEGELWAERWCGRCAQCPTGQDGCNLLDVAAVGRIPAEWIEIGHADGRWQCLSWEPSAGYVDLGKAIGLEL